MRPIGLIGGTSWRSTAEYYRLLNELTAERLGGLHSARIILYSVDFEPLAAAQHHGDWDLILRELTAAAVALKDAGAQFFLLCANTMHKLAEELEETVDLPLLHIADAVGEALADAGTRTAGLLGTRFTMEGEFIRSRIEDRFGCEMLIPPEADREEIHRIIYEELCRGIESKDSRARVRSVIDDLKKNGARGVVLACTELPLLIQPEDTDIPLFDSTLIHARAAVERALT